MTLWNYRTIPIPQNMECIPSILLWGAEYSE